MPAFYADLGTKPSSLVTTLGATGENNAGHLPIICPLRTRYWRRCLTALPGYVWYHGEQHVV